MIPHNKWFTNSSDEYIMQNPTKYYTPVPLSDLRHPMNILYQLWFTNSSDDYPVQNTTKYYTPVHPAKQSHPMNKWFFHSFSKIFKDMLKCLHGYRT